MSEEKKKHETKGNIEAFKLHSRTFGRLTVGATTLATLPQDAFKSTGGLKSSPKPPPARNSRD